MSWKIRTGAGALLIATQLALPSGVNAQSAPSAQQQFDVVMPRCQSLVVTGNRAGNPDPASVLRMYIGLSTADVSGRLAQQRQWDSAPGGPAAMAGSDPNARTAHALFLESFCFLEGVLEIRRTGVASAPSAPAFVGQPDRADGGIYASVADAMKLANEAQAEELQRRYDAEPQPAPPPAPGQRPTSPPPVLAPMHRKDAPSCLSIEMDQPALNGDRAWYAEVRLVNRCGYAVLARLDSAEQDEGDPELQSYSSRGTPLSVTNVVVTWDHVVPLPSDLGFTPAEPRGEGAVVDQGVIGLYLASGIGPRRILHFWLIACREREEGSDTPNVMFVSDSTLNTGAKFKCVPFQPRP